MALADKTCRACHGGVPKLSAPEYQEYLAELEGWQVQGGHLVKSYKFKDFAAAMKLANKIADLAEDQGHHPDLLVRWGELRVELWTHAIDGLSESDFVLAAKIDRL
jgi:4a-hydroxytetrahydrobiopterin dehydratase